MRPAVHCLVTLAIAGAATTAHADRGWHGSAGAGGSFLLTGSQGDRWRFDAQLDIKPQSRFGILVGWHGFDPDHSGIVRAGLLYEAGAARPLLALDLHADAGFDLDQRAPLVGAGIRTTLVLFGPLGIALDTGAHLVIDGVDDSRLVLASGTYIVAGW
ncbi:MAG: hypothetical protein AB7P03_00080 [Kofleriaceae bacterium]